MACTAVIRYLCVVKRTLHHRFVKPKTVAVVIAILWLLNVIVQSLPLLLSSGHGIYNSKVGYYYYFLPERDVGNTVNYTGVAVAVFLGLLILMAYFKVFRLFPVTTALWLQTYSREIPCRERKLKLPELL